MTYNNQKLKTLFYALFCISVIPVTLYAADWTPTLAKSQKNYRQAQEHIKINIPTSVSAAVITTLKMEVDNIDVTDQVKINGNIISYKPLQPLSKGFHNIRLVEFASDGNILERGQWKLEVRKSKLFRDSSYMLNTDLSLSSNIAKKNITLEGGNIQGQGTIAWASTAANKKWRYSSSFNAIYNNQSSQTTFGKSFDLADYLFTGDASRTGFKIGHHGINVGNMLIDGFNSRGISVRHQSSTGRSVFGGFSMRSQLSSGFRNGLGVTQGQNRTSGVYGQFFPNKTNPERLNINVAYIDGKCQGTGEAAAGGDCESTLVKQGDGYSISADSTSKNTRWRVRGEYAATRFDVDGINVGFAAENSKAWTLLTVYTAKGKTIGNNTLNWNIALERKRVGRYFISLTNSALPRDKLVTSATHTLTYKGIYLTTKFGTETDNVDDDPLLPRIKTNIYNMTLNWTPQSSMQDPEFTEINNGTGQNKKKKKKKKKKFKLFAQATYTLSYSNTARETKIFPIAFLGIRPDDVTDIILFDVNFTPGKWNWGFNHTYTLANDDSNDIAINRNNQSSNVSSLTITYPVTDNFAFGPNIQYNTINNRATNVDETNTTIGLTTTFVWKTKLTGVLTYNYINNDTTDNSNNSNAHITDLNIDYKIREANNNRPGISWFVKGNWNTLNTAENNYQIHTGIRIGWPIAK